MAKKKRKHSVKRAGAFPWLLAGGAAAAAFLLWPKAASAAGGGGGGGGGGGAPGIPAGKYVVSTIQTGTAGDLALRSTPQVDASNANLVEWLPHGSTVQASGQVANGFAAVMAPDGKTGYASLDYLHLAGPGV